MGKVGTSISAATNRKELFDAFLLALEANTNTGGGGGGLTVPDVVVTGSGSSNYVIPAGFNAVVVATQGIQDYIVKGQTILNSSAEILLTNTNIQVSNAAAGTYIYNTNNYGVDLSHSGSFVFGIIGPQLGIVMAWQFFVGSVLVGSGGQTFYTSNRNTTWSDVPLLQGETIRLVVSAYVNGGSGPWNTSLVGEGSTKPTSGSVVTTTLLEGDIISGGRYIIALYAI